MDDERAVTSDLPTGRVGQVQTVLKRSARDADYAGVGVARPGDRQALARANLHVAAWFVGDLGIYASRSVEQAVV